jgi:hypothetical protein
MNVCFFPTNRQTIYFRVIEICWELDCVKTSCKSCVMTFGKIKSKSKSKSKSKRREIKSKIEEWLRVRVRLV